MRPKSIILLVVALGCGLVASIGINQVLANRNAGGSAEAETIPIFVAKKDIFTGDKLTPENVNLEEWPKSKVPSGAVTTLQELEDRRARGKFYAGEPILDVKLLAKGQLNSSPTDMIPPGFRAIPIRVDDEKGAAGMVGPGDRVDLQVHVTANPNTGILKTQTRTFLHSIKVFAVDKTVTRTETGEQTVSAKTISLLLTPKQADMVTLASEVGKIRLVMRGTGEDDSLVDDHDPAVLDDVLGPQINEQSKPAETQPNHDLINIIKQQPATEPVAAAPGMHRMVVIEGTSVREVEVPADGSLAPQANPAPPAPSFTAPPPSSPDTESSSGSGAGGNPAPPQ